MSACKSIINLSFAGNVQRRSKTKGLSKSTFRILFYLRKNYLNKSGKAGIMVRLTVNGDMVERKAETQTSTGVSADKTAIVEAEQEKKPKRGG